MSFLSIIILIIFLLFFFSSVSLEVYHFILSKIELLISIIFSIHFLSYFTDFSSDLYYFIYFGFKFLFFLEFLKVEGEVTGLRPSFSNIGIWYYI